jgi:peroxiredoxin Q/BCP
MKSIAAGDRAPDFSGADQSGRQLSLSDFRGKQTLVLFFYPADESPICTREACAFRDAYQDFCDAGAVVIGISADGKDSHQRFADRHRLPFPLLSDRDGSLRRAFGISKTLGLLPGRVTYVIDPDGVVRHVFSSQLGADRHVQEALAVVRRIVADDD